MNNFESERERENNGFRAGSPFSPFVLTPPPPPPESRYAGYMLSSFYKDIFTFAASTNLEKQQHLGQEYNIFRFRPHIVFINLGPTQKITLEI